MANDPRLHVDARWAPIAHDWLSDAGLPDKIAMRYTSRLAQILHDQAEQFVESDLPDLERDRDEAARDAHIHRQIDEARGK